MDLLKKLQVKDLTQVLVLNPPKEFEPVLDDWQKTLTVKRSADNEKSPFLLLFVKDRTQLEENKTILQESSDTLGLIWVAYPKKSSKRYRSDISRDDFWDAYKDIGLEPVRQIALTEDWSALRFRPGELIKRKNP